MSSWTRTSFPTTNRKTKGLLYSPKIKTENFSFVKEMPAVSDGRDKTSLPPLLADRNTRVVKSCSLRELTVQKVKLATVRLRGTSQNHIIEGIKNHTTESDPKRTDHIFSTFELFMSGYIKGIQEVRLSSKPVR